jgi:nicotinate dehydrogenase subunit B
VTIIAAGLAWAALRPKEIPLAEDARSATHVGLQARGAELAQIGNCADCHTAPGGAPYAGGRALKTSFGTIYSTNVTPSRSGVGGWTYEAFRRAMTEGVSRDGHFLYPAFPFDHFRRLEERDLEDLYGFLMTRAPVEAAPPSNRMIWPFGFRPLLAVWRLIFLHGETPKPDASQSAEWNRGRYLVEALAHCGACHTPRNRLGAEDAGRSYDGGWSDGWYAPPLNKASPAPRAWTESDLYAYLRSGFSARHAAAAGPMGDVTRSLGAAPDADVRAIAVYAASLLLNAARPSPEREPPREAAALFEGACAPCHEDGAPMMQLGRPPLSSGTPLYEPTPRDTLAIVLNGLSPAAGRAGPTMPAFADAFDDPEIAALAAFLRAKFTDLPPWPQDLRQEARLARTETQP